MEIPSILSPAARDRLIENEVATICAGRGPPVTWRVVASASMQYCSHVQNLIGLRLRLTQQESLRRWEE